MHILKQSELDGMPCPDTLIHGECLEAMKHIADGSVDMICADLPYGTTACKWDTVIPFAPLWEAYKRVIKPNGAIVLFSSQPFTTDLINSNRKWFRYEWIWQKERGSNWQHANRQPMKVHENVLVFYDKQPVYNSQKTDTDNYHVIRKPAIRARLVPHLVAGKCAAFNPGGTYVGKFPISVQQFTRDKQVHPTQKPVALLEYLVRTYTNPGDLVLDNCMGSGTTPAACIRTGRHFIGIELDPVYFAAGVERIRGELAQPPLMFDAPPAETCAQPGQTVSENLSFAY